MQGRRCINLQFFLTEIGDRDLILGYPWFAAVQPAIDWAQGWIETEQLPIILKMEAARNAWFLPRQINVPRWPPEEAMHIAFVMFPDMQVLQRQTVVSQLAKQARTRKTDPLPPHYRRHAHVFSKKELQRFPGPRIWDHAIKLKKDAPATLPGKIYALTQKEQEMLEEFIHEHQKKGYIRPSKSPYALPFFFIKKKNGKLRPVQDYRWVNEWTIRNWYPLPLIPELIAHVKDAALFTKFDMRWGYNNIHIWQEDEWKAAFITNKGLYEPRVMFFGLTNSLATFQTMMNAIFLEEIQEGWVTIYMDNILIHTADNIEDHQKKVHRILDKLRQNDLFLKPEKCLFEKRTMEFLGIVLEKGTIQMDSTKVKGVADWPRPQMVKDIRAFLGFTGFYRYFIPNYSAIACPLIELTRKATPFHWEEPQVKAFETLKTLMCWKPILHQTDYSKPFFLATDASAYGMGAVLSQEGELNPRTHKPIQHPIAYYPTTFSPTERNYNIYEWELLAVMKALEHWRPHLAATETPAMVLTDHTNLTYWKNPKKVNRRVARWFATLQDYNLRIKHIPGKLHAAPDMLSCSPNADKGEEDNQDLTLLPLQLFIWTNTEPAAEWETLVRTIEEAQSWHPLLMKDWSRKYKLKYEANLWKKEGRIVVLPDEKLLWLITQRHHDLPIKGHPGQDWTIQEVEWSFWWLTLKTWIAKYLKGCATCQQNKTRSHPTRPPPFKIPVPMDALPFQIVAMDLITQLPKSNGYDAILMVVDHGCTWATVFLPCNSTTTGEGVARLYYDYIYWWFGLPTRIISDWDPRFTSHFAKALCTQLGIQQNLSTAFHPQTDGLSERKNQWVELFLRQLTSAQQDDWADWLLIAMAVHNHFTNASTKVAPSEALLGYLPRMDYLTSPPTLNERVEQRTRTAQAWSL